jgi:DNA-binding MarR family transcriptional regulator
MENILDVLKAMKKATSREVAARLQIEPQTALDMLREHEERFEVVQSNGYWWATKAGDMRQKGALPKAVPPVRVTPFDLKGVLMEKGPLQADQLAKITGATAKGVATMLTNLVTKGEVSREKVGNKFVYSIPAAPVDAAPVDTVPETAAPPVPVDIAKEMAAKTTAEIVQDIPVFTARADDLVIPSSRFISQEIRRTKTKLANLEKLQVAVRELRRHKNLLAGIRDA